MSKITTKLECTISLELTPGEAKALAAIAGYGPKKFKEWFYNNMGKNYLEPFATHIDTLFVKARKLDTAVDNLVKASEQIKVINV